MLQLKNIIKTYKMAGSETTVLKSVNINFREQEFVSILGASGSGKTTLLNIIGGLDKYTSGDMLVAGKSTKNFTDGQWDSYRNGTIGFVFQSYNLISHLSVLENVKLALSISGISNNEANERAKKSLKDVGLEDHINKKPSQLSGGQMQRVAIARALVTNPKIILADEPTGALDSKTSVQIMELIREISKDKLVIMVTHNPGLAEQYSDRIVKVSDGEIIEDTNKYELGDKENKQYSLTKTAMSFGAALKSSFKNLLTKKVRTIMTTIAGSIGIISIGLVLSISAGMNKYIAQMQNENLASMPITISESQVNFGASDEREDSKDNGDKIVAKSRGEVHKNIYNEDALGSGENFIKYLENNAKNYYSNIGYTNGYNLKVLAKNSKGEIVQVKEENGSFTSSNIFGQLPVDKNIILTQFEIIKSLDGYSYPEKSNEVVLFVNKNNSIDSDVLKALGYSSSEEVKFADIVGKELSVVDNNAYYKEQSGRFFPTTANNDMYNNGTKVKIVAILKAKDSFTRSDYGIGYTKTLADELIAKEKDSSVVKAQQNSMDKNVITGENLTAETRTILMRYLGGDTTPSSILIYPKTFSDRDKIAETIANYNKKIEEKYGAGSENYVKYSITYADLAKQVTGIMSQMINTISLILTAFAAISLIVSSIMIGILTYVSVVERTKEIGILRAIGARKKDVTRIFRAEAMIIGFTSGALGVIVAMLLSIPIGRAIKKALEIDGFNASLSLTSATLLIVISVALTLIASIIPARMAAKKNPVEALRSE